MTEERVTVRIDADLLKKIDEAVESDINIANRSHFFRVAAEEKLQSQSENIQTENAQTDIISIKMPAGLITRLEDELNGGWFSKIDEIIAASLRERYEYNKYKKKLIEESLEQEANTLHVMRK